MKAILLTITMAALLAGCDTSSETVKTGNSTGDRRQAVMPDPSACPPPEHAYNEMEFGKRDDPLTLPAEVATYAATDGINLAVKTLGGGQLCQDASWTYTLTNAELLGNGRFLAMEWSAYETFGTFLFDRSGSGLEVETGKKPVFSPTGDRMAALQISNSGFGVLENLAIWQVEPTGLHEVFRMPEDHQVAWSYRDFDDFVIDRWEGEACLMITAVASKDAEVANWDWQRARRTPFHARESAGWQITQGSCR